MIIITVVPGFFLYNYARSPFTPGFGIFPTLNETDRDKARLIHNTLEHVYSENALPDLDSLLEFQGEPIVVSTENLGIELMPRIGVYETKFVEPSKILGESEKVRERSSRPLMFLAFNKLEFRRPGMAHIELQLRSVNPYGEVLSPNGGYRYSVLSLIYLIYQKENGQWSISYQRVGIS